MYFQAQHGKTREPRERITLDMRSFGQERPHDFHALHDAVQVDPVAAGAHALMAGADLLLYGNHPGHTIAPHKLISGIREIAGCTIVAARAKMRTVSNDR